MALYEEDGGEWAGAGVRTAPYRNECSNAPSRGTGSTCPHSASRERERPSSTEVPVVRIEGVW